MNPHKIFRNTSKYTLVCSEIEVGFIREMIGVNSRKKIQKCSAFGWYFHNILVINSCVKSCTQFKKKKKNDNSTRSATSLSNPYDK